MHLKDQPNIYFKANLYMLNYYLIFLFKYLLNREKLYFLHMFRSRFVALVGREKFFSVLPTMILMLSREAERQI